MQKFLNCLESRNYVTKLFCPSNTSHSNETIQFHSNNLGLVRCFCLAASAPVWTSTILGTIPEYTEY